MEWFALAGPVPAAVEFNGGGAVMTVVALLIACVPLLLVARNARRGGVRAADEAPQLRVIEGGKEPGRRAA